MAWQPTEVIMTQYLLTIVTDHQKSCLKTGAKDERTATENVRCDVWSSRKNLEKPHMGVASTPFLYVWGLRSLHYLSIEIAFDSDTNRSCKSWLFIASHSWRENTRSAPTSIANIWNVSGQVTFLLWPINVVNNYFLLPRARRLEYDEIKTDSVTLNLSYNFLQRS